MTKTTLLRSALLVASLLAGSIIYLWTQPGAEAPLPPAPVTPAVETVPVPAPVPPAVETAPVVPPATGEGEDDAMAPAPAAPGAS